MSPFYTTFPLDAEPFPYFLLTTSTRLNYSRNNNRWRVRRWRTNVSIATVTLWK